MKSYPVKFIFYQNKQNIFLKKNIWNLSAKLNGLYRSVLFICWCQNSYLFFLKVLGDHGFKTAFCMGSLKMFSTACCSSCVLSFSFFFLHCTVVKMSVTLAIISLFHLYCAHLIYVTCLEERLILNPHPLNRFPNENEHPLFLGSRRVIVSLFEIIDTAVLYKRL